MLLGKFIIVRDEDGIVDEHRGKKYQILDMDERNFYIVTDNGEYKTPNFRYLTASYYVEI